MNSCLRGLMVCIVSCNAAACAGKSAKAVVEFRVVVVGACAVCGGDVGVDDVAAGAAAMGAPVATVVGGVGGSGLVGAGRAGASGAADRALVADVDDRVGMLGADGAEVGVAVLVDVRGGDGDDGGGGRGDEAEDVGAVRVGVDSVIARGAGVFASFSCSSSSSLSLSVSVSSSGPRSIIDAYCSARLASPPMPVMNRLTVPWFVLSHVRTRLQASATGLVMPGTTRSSMLRDCSSRTNDFIALLLPLRFSVLIAPAVWLSVQTMILRP